MSTKSLLCVPTSLQGRLDTQTSVEHVKNTGGSVGKQKAHLNICFNLFKAASCTQLTWQLIQVPHSQQPIYRPNNENTVNAGRHTWSKHSRTDPNKLRTCSLHLERRAGRNLESFAVCNAHVMVQTHNVATNNPYKTLT